MRVSCSNTVGISMTTSTICSCTSDAKRVRRNSNILQTRNMKQIQLPPTVLPSAVQAPLSFSRCGQVSGQLSAQRATRYHLENGLSAGALGHSKNYKTNRVPKSSSQTIAEPFRPVFVNERVLVDVEPNTTHDGCRDHFPATGISPANGGQHTTSHDGIPATAISPASERHHTTKLSFTHVLQLTLHLLSRLQSANVGCPSNGNFVHQREEPHCVVSTPQIKPRELHGTRALKPAMCKFIAFVPSNAASKVQRKLLGSEPNRKPHTPQIFVGEVGWPLPALFTSSMLLKHTEKSFTSATELLINLSKFIVVHQRSVPSRS